MTSIRRLVLALAVAAASPAPARAGSLYDRVNKAIDRGVDWLKKRQLRDGSWGPVGGDPYEGSYVPYDYPAGTAALALLTLLKCGVPPNDPVVERGFAFIRTKHRVPGSNYEISTLILALEARANRVKRERKREMILKMKAAGAARKKGIDLKVTLPRQDLVWMRELVGVLVKQRTDNAWRYNGRLASNPGRHHKDMSNTQLAVMALQVAQRCGIKLKPRVIREVVEWALAEQQPGGPEHPRPKPARSRYAPVVDRARGWAYIRRSRTPDERTATGTMTTGGLVVLLAGRAMLKELDPQAARSLRKRIDTSVSDGMAWLDRNWTVARNPGGEHYHLMYLYGVERACDLLRVSLVGRHSWYEEGAEWLVGHQFDDGRWEKRDTHPPFDILNTCFALLFLDRATLTVVTRR